MSLSLDTRQRAMLAEMGVRVWQPVTALAPEPAHPAAPALPEPVAHSDLPTSPAAVHPPAKPPSPTHLTKLPEGIANMDWPSLASAVEHCQACAMCLGRRTPVLAPPQTVTFCDWLVLGDPPDEPEERAGQPFVEDTGQLLDNMLRAVGVQRWNRAGKADSAQEASSRAYLTHVLKCRPALMRAPDAAELGTCAHFLRREIALTQPKVILAMGRFAMQLLLSETPPEQARLPLGKLRGQVWRFAGVPVVVTYPPVYLLRNGHDKARAWADLCLARAVAKGSLATP
jgi:uracil-DNA glycosylase